MDVFERYRPVIDDLEAFRRACDRPLPTVVRVNSIKSTTDQVTRALDEDEIQWRTRKWTEQILVLDADGPDNNWPYFHGWIHGQEEISQLPAMILDPQPGETVWDATAAPGGKATQLAARMNDSGFLVANDDNLGRLASLRFNTQRLGVTNTAVTNRDARNFSLKPFDFERFDRVLVDAPCSCEGTVRKNPTVMADWSPDQMTSIANVQKNILRRAVQVTRPEGVVVYSTCTFAPEENEAVVDHALATEDCTVVPYDVDLEHRAGVTEWRGQTYDPAVRHAKRFYPHHNDTGGFFCAKLVVAK